MKRVLLILVLCLVAVPLAAQTANQAQLRLVVVDQTGAGIPNATIVVTPATGASITVTSDERGLATVPDSHPARCSCTWSFPASLPTTPP